MGQTYKFLTCMLSSRTFKLSYVNPLSYEIKPQHNRHMLCGVLFWTFADLQRMLKYNKFTGF